MTSENEPAKCGRHAMFSPSRFMYLIFNMIMQGNVRLSRWRSRRSGEVFTAKARDG
jgi:hypothetical protein